MIQLEYDKDSVFLNSGIALSEKGETKEIGIDETFGDLQKPINGKEEFALPQLIDQNEEHDVDMTELRIQDNQHYNDNRRS